MKKRLRDTYGLCNIEIDLAKGEDKGCLTTLKIKMN